MHIKSFIFNSCDTYLTLDELINNTLPDKLPRPVPLAPSSTTAQQLLRHNSLLAYCW